MAAVVNRCQRPRVDVRYVQIALVDREVFPQQQLAIVEGPVERVPGVLLPSDDQPRCGRRVDVRKVDVVARAIAIVAVEGNTLAVVRPDRVAVDELSLRELPYVPRPAVVVELRILVSALVLQKHEAGRGARLSCACDRDWIARVRELLTHP